MRWPWQRRRDDEAAAGAAADAPAPSVPRPRGQWRDVEPLHPAGAAELSAAEPLGFVRTLSTRWQVPPALEPLGHEVSLTAPAGHVPVAGAPVTGYPDPPELVWAAVPDLPADVAPDATWRRAPARVEHAPAEPEGAALQRPEVVAAALPAPRSAPSDRPEQLAADPRVRDLVGDQDPLPLQRSRGIEQPATPAVVPSAATPSDDAVVGPADLPLRHSAPAAQEAAAARTETPHPMPEAVVRPRPAQEELLGPLAGEERRAQTLEPVGPDLSAPPVAPEPSPASVVASPVRPEPVPDAPVRTVRPVVGRRPALADAPSLRAASDLGTAVEAPPVTEPEPQPSYDQPAAPGLGVPEWFSSGPVRPATPEPDPAPGTVPRPVAREAAAPALRKSVEHLAGPTGVEDRPRGPAAPDLLVARGPRRVAWPLDPPDGSAGDDEPEGPDDAIPDQDTDEEPEGDAADAPPPVAARVDQVAALPSPVARRAVEQDSWTPDPRSARSDPARAPASPRRFRVGAPLPRPASARPVPAPSGLAAFAAASQAAAGVAADDPSWEPDLGLRATDDDLPEPGALRARLLPSDLGLPGLDDEAPAARARATDPVVDDADDLDDDEPTRSADEIYEQVRTRLRHELMVDRERAALLVD